MTELIQAYDNPPSEKAISKALDVLNSGGILAYPTDLNWGFGCDYANVRAIDKLQSLKPYHPKERPFSLLCSDLRMVSSVANLDNTAYRLCKTIWPGPYTVLLQRNKNLPRQINDKRKIVGVRIPDSNLLRTLIERFSSPILTTSIPDISEYNPLRYGYQVKELYNNRVDLILDLDKEILGKESTVLDFSTGELIVVREGAGSTDFLEK